MGDTGGSTGASSRGDEDSDGGTDAGMDSATDSAMDSTGPGAGSTTNPGGETGDASTGDSGAADEGDTAPVVSSLTWRVDTVECPAGEQGLIEVLDDGPLMLGAASLVFGDASRFVNGAAGASTQASDAGTLELDCGSGNSFESGTEIVTARAVVPGSGADGVPLRWETYDVECPDVDGFWAAAEGVDPGFVAALYAAGSEASGWAINTSQGWGAYVDAGAQTLQIPCGSGNGHAPGTRIRVALGYDDAPVVESLEWEVHEGACGDGPTEIATGIDVDFAAVSFLFGSDSRWSIVPLFGLGSRLTADGRIEIACGMANDLPPGTDVRVALGYAR